MTQSLEELDQFLRGSGGGGAPACFNKYDGPGTTRGGRILKIRKTQQTQFGTNKPLWFDKEETKPREQLEVTVQTDLRDPSREEDDGARRHFIKGRELTDKVFEACDAVGAPGLRVGGELYITRVASTKESGSNGTYDAWVHAVRYVPPAPEQDAFLQNGGNGAAQGNGNGHAVGVLAQPVQAAAPQQQVAQPAYASPQAQAAPVAPVAPPVVAPPVVAPPVQNGDSLTPAELAKLSPEQQAAIASLNLPAAQVRLMFAAQLGA